MLIGVDRVALLAARDVAEGPSVAGALALDQLDGARYITSVDPGGTAAYQS
jgi:hypothetical protein